MAVDSKDVDKSIISESRDLNANGSSSSCIDATLEVPNYLSILEEEMRKREQEQKQKEMQQKLYQKRLEAAYKQVLQIVTREDVEDDIKTKVVIKFSQDFPKNPYLSEFEIGKYLPTFSISLDISGPEDHLGIYVNGLYTGKKVPSKVELRRGDIVSVDKVGKGAWVINGNEKYIRFKREPIEEGNSIYADVGEGDKLIGYSFKESTTQEEFDALVSKSSELRVISIRDCKGVKSINSLTKNTGLWALDAARSRFYMDKSFAVFKALRFANFRETNVTDISPLSNLEELRWLSLWGTSVLNLAPLANLRRLTGLNIIGAPVSDISPLLGLKSLKSIYLRDSRISHFHIELLKVKLPDCRIYF